MPRRPDTNPREYTDETSETFSSTGIRSRKSSFCCLEPENCNWNTINTLCFVGSNSVTYSLWGNPLLPSFIYLATGEQYKVGIAEAVQGVTQVCAALLGGYLADKFTRGLVLKMAAVIQLLAGGLTLMAIFWDIHWVEPMRRSHNFSTSAPMHPFSFASVNFFERQCNTSVDTGDSMPDMPQDIAQAEFVQWWFILAACGAWGLYAGAYGPALAAIFADSVMTGKRSKIYTWREMIKNLCRAAGPLISLFAFFTLGNKWNLHILGVIMAGGIALTLVPGIFLCLFRDSKSLKDTSRSVLEADRDREWEEEQDDAAKDSREAEPHLDRPLLEAAGEGFDDQVRERPEHRYSASAAFESIHETVFVHVQTVCIGIGVVVATTRPLSVRLRDQQARPLRDFGEQHHQRAGRRHDRQVFPNFLPDQGVP